MLFHSISEGDVIRTTPTQSPRSTRFHPMSTTRGNLYKHQSAVKDATPGSVLQRSGSQSDDSFDNQTTAADDRAPLSGVAEAPLAVQDNEKGKAVRRPPPILKGTRTDSSKQQPKTARILTPTWKSDVRDQESDGEVSPTTSTSADIESKPSTDTLPPSGSDEERSDDESQSPSSRAKPSAARNPLSRPTESEAKPPAKANKKKSAFVASTASAKRRPTIVRRKSSQSSSSNNTSKVPSPRLPTQCIPASPPSLPKLPSPRPTRSLLAHPSGIKSSNFPPLAESPPDVSRSTQSRPARASRSASPSTSRPFQDSSLDALSPPRNTVDTTEALPLQDWLVDRDFRAKFVDRSLASTLLANPSIPASSSRNQSISSQDDDASQVKGKEKGKMVDSNVAIKPPGAESSAIEDDEDEPTSVVLPRTKSQLTLLVENERKRESEKKGKQRRSNRGKNV